MDGEEVEEDDPMELQDLSPKMLNLRHLARPQDPGPWIPYLHFLPVEKSDQGNQVLSI